MKYSNSAQAEIGQMLVIKRELVESAVIIL